MQDKSTVSDCFFFFEELRIVLAKEKKRLSYSPKQEERQAGIDRFEKFGELPTLLSLAKILNKNIEEILLEKYNFIHLILYHEAEKAKYNDKLHEIYSKK